MLEKCRIESTHFIRWRGSTIGDACRFNGFRDIPKIAESCSGRTPDFRGTMPCAMNWVGFACGRGPARNHREGVLDMRNQTIGHHSDCVRLERTDRGAGTERTVGMCAAAASVINDEPAASPSINARVP